MFNLGRIIKQLERTFSPNTTTMLKIEYLIHSYVLINNKCNNSFEHTRSDRCTWLITLVRFQINFYLKCNWENIIINNYYHYNLHFMGTG